MTLPVNRAIIVERFEKTAAHGPVAQLGERRVRIAEAEGSNPFGSTKQVLDEHLFLQRRFRREVFALIHNRKAPPWEESQDGAFLYF